MSVVRWAEVANLRSLCPPGVRRCLHALKKSLFHRQVHLVLRHVEPGREHRRLLVFGEPFSDWVPALTAVETWRGIPEIDEVVLQLDDSMTVIPPAATAGTTIVLPLREDALAAATASCKGLFPRPDVVEILHNKRRFAEYVVVNGLARFCPVNYLKPADIRLPCIVKPVRDYDGATVVRTAEALDAMLADKAWRPERFAIQEFIPGAVEYTTHAILKDGRPLWSRSFVFEKDGDIRPGIEFKSMAPCEPPPALFEAVERILAPLNYSGPCNFDYALRPSGGIALFEINPRFGGTLFLPQNHQYLRDALRCLVQAALENIRPST